MMNYGPWHTHYEAFHICASQGNLPMLKAMLEYADPRLGRQKLSGLLNVVTKNGRGSIDLALKASRDCRNLLRLYGAVEQAAPPAKWTKGNRRDSDYAYQQQEAKRVLAFVDN